MAGGIALVGLALRLPMYGDSLFEDELLSYFLASAGGPGDTIDLVYRGQELSPPLFFAAASVSENLLGASAEALRAPSLLAGSARPLQPHRDQALLRRGHDQPVRVRASRPGPRHQPDDDGDLRS